MPWTPAQHWLFPEFRLAWAERPDAPRAATAGFPSARCVCNLRIAWLNPTDRPARYAARFTGTDGRPLDDLRFGGVLAPRAAVAFDLLGHPALTAGLAVAEPRTDVERSGWLELHADAGVQVSVSQEGLDERPATGMLERWSRELRPAAGPRAGSEAGGAAGDSREPVEPIHGPSAASWHSLDALLRPAPPARSRPGDPLAVERRRDPRCDVIRRDIEQLERAFERLRVELQHAPSARREGLRLQIDAVQSERRTLAAEAAAYGCAALAATPAVPAPLAVALHAGASR